MMVVSVMTMSVSDEMVHHQSDAVTHVHLSDAAPSHHRHRRRVHSLTPQERSQVVDHHNALRAQEGASNMQMMSWSDFLASLAETWAAGCDWRHGQPPLGDDPQYTSIGQNLFATTSSSVNLTGAIQSWYDENAYYSYETLACADGQMCGHYTQVVWATSRHVGCAYHPCQPLRGSFSKATYLVCNYGPAGNYAGAKPYTKGPACSQCGSGAGWCSKDGLCNGECRAPSGECSCAAHCYNCATLDQHTTCRCSCVAGWRGDDCSVPCEDTDAHCGASPGWTDSSWCNRDYVRRGCPNMCNVCTPDPDAEPSKCPPVYGPGAHFSTATSFIGVHQVSLLSAMVVMSLTIRPRDALYRL